MLSTCCAVTADKTPQTSPVHLHIQPLLKVACLPFTGSRANFTSLALPFVSADNDSCTSGYAMQICMFWSTCMSTYVSASLHR